MPHSEKCASFIQLFLINRFVNFQIFHARILYLLKTFNSEFSYIEVWFADQNSKLLKVEVKINMTLVEYKK